MNEKLYCDNCKRKRNKQVELELRSYSRGVGISELTEKRYERTKRPRSQKTYYKCPECGSCYEKTEWDGLEPTECPK